MNDDPLADIESEAYERETEGGSPVLEPIHSIEAEQAMLGAILVNNEGYYRCAEVVSAEHFFEPVHARIWDSISDAISKSQLVSPITLAPMFRDDATLKEIGGVVYLARLAGAATTIINAPEYARVIYDTWLRRHAEQVTTSMLDRLRTDRYQSNASDTIEETISALAKRREGDVAKRPISIGRSGDSVIARLNDAYMKGVPTQNFAHPGSHDLARVIGGWRRGRFYVIAGRPSMGKSTTALSFLLRTAAKGHGVLFFSLEMGRDELTEIALCDLAWSPSNRVEYRDITAEAVVRPEFERNFGTVMGALPLLTSMPLTIDDRGGLTIAQIRAAAGVHAQRLAGQGKRLDVIAVDHLGLIRASDRYNGNKVAETEEVSSNLKQMAKEMDCAVVSMVQINRQSEAREDKRPALSDLRWSGAIEQDADCIMFVYREAYYLERKRFDEMTAEQERQERLAEVNHKLEIQVAKQRGGPCPMIEFYTDIGCGVVRDMDRRHG